MVHEKNFSRLGMGPPGQTLVDWAWNLQNLVNWAWNLQEKQQAILIQGSTGNRRTAAHPRQSRDQGSRRWQSEDWRWRGGTVVEAGAEVIINLLAEVGLLIYPGAGSL